MPAHEAQLRAQTYQPPFSMLWRASLNAARASHSLGQSQLSLK